MHAVSAMFDTLKNVDDYMDTGLWKNAHAYLSRVSKDVTVLLGNKTSGGRQNVSYTYSKLSISVDETCLVHE